MAPERTDSQVPPSGTVLLDLDHEPVGVVVGDQPAEDLRVAVEAVLGESHPWCDIDRLTAMLPCEPAVWRLVRNSDRDGHMPVGSPSPNGTGPPCHVVTFRAARIRAAADHPSLLQRT